MANTTTLKRKNTQTLSGGRIASIVEVDGEEIRLIASSRRKKTISAALRDDMIQLSVPADINDQTIIDSARNLIAKVKERQHRDHHVLSDTELYHRALHLARTWLDSQVEPFSVVWSNRQTTLWGSCTPSTSRIRLSSTLKTMPQWVIDGVIVHEMAHLKYPDHGDDFQKFAHQYPKMAQADAFLDGVSYAQQQDEASTEG